MWICNKCKTEIEDDCKICWNCGYDRTNHINKTSSRLIIDFQNLESNSIKKNSFLYKYSPSIFTALIVLVLIVSTPPILSFFLILILIVVIFFNLKSARILNNKSEIIAAIEETDDFKISKILFDEQALMAIAVDNIKMNVCLVEKSTNEFSISIYNCNEILATEVIQNGITITETKTSRGSQLAGAIVGGALFGGVGALVGGLSGKTRSESTNKIIDIELRIIVNDTESPYFVLRVDNMKTAQEWHSLLRVYIKMGEKETISGEKIINTNIKTDYSIADEINKLNKLKLAGIITEGEFNARKQKLLDGL